MSRSDWSRTLVMVTRNGMGSGPPELQHRLLEKWLHLIRDTGQMPGAIALYAEGVLVAAQDSPHVEALRDLEHRGCRIILCQTCIEAFGLGDSLAVGVVGGMGDILVAQELAEKVISL